jgi:hypothetical protein
MLWTGLSLSAQTLEFVEVPEGYRAGSIALPLPFAGALADDPYNDHRIYTAVGSFGNMKVARVDLLAGSVTVCATGPFGSLAGMAVLSATQLALVENAGVPGGYPDETLLLASDLNGDGDFDDELEIEQLVAPILAAATDNWTGSQARVAPPGDPSGIPSGSLLVQTADGNGQSELLVIANPLSSPQYRPQGGAFYSGFDFNGGFDFDTQGNLLLGTATASFAGNVLALVDTNRDLVIDASEANLVVGSEGLPNGISDLVIDGENDTFCSTGGAIETFRVLGNPLTASATPEPFATTDAGFLYGMILSARHRPFSPTSGPRGAVLVTSGFTASFESANNLLTLTPEVSFDLNADGRVDGLDLLLFQEQWHHANQN